MKIINFVLIVFVFHWGTAQGLQEAQDFYQSGNSAKAIQTLEQIVKENPKDEKALSLMGKIYAEKENWERASTYYSELVNIAPSNADYNFKYGGALGLYAKTLNKFKAVFLVEDVKKHLNKAARLDPNHIEVRWALVQLYLELPSIIGGSIEKARSYANELEEISPVDGALTKGLIAEEEKDFKAAENYYKKAVSLRKSTLTYQKLVDLYLKTDQTQKAKKTAEKAYKTTNEDNFLKKVNHIN
ncbi:tetratricopeptide repeat protein [Psychroflexus maritimus]|uniref:Tetratricopeptide repeat protein n=1 Tax=Psychroflexus maritimus TaxID=2714865 RepID=A0A967DZ23_9FLAO|nr:tetratricopeptide repeat protein [Psychroflexus maritimus]NGZ90440.1 tetratricopeptide repeat protein [Psychroflexus maritimus]